MAEIKKVLSSFPRTFWIANTMELFERWAWYGLFAVLPLYLTNSTDEGALGFTQTEKGDIMGIVTAILYLLPIVTGALADRFGFRKVLIVAYLMLSSGYFMMGQFGTYGLVFFSFLYVAVGAAMFKPVISATVAKTTNEKNSSIGFGLFYMMVNIGGFLGPVVASKLIRSFDWSFVFIMSTSSIIINLLLVLFFFKEPNPPSVKSKGIIYDYGRIILTMFSSMAIFISGFIIFFLLFISETIFLFAIKERYSFKFADFINTLPIGDANKKIFSNITTIFRDYKFVTFLLLMVGFWTMFNQIFYTLPNFIDQWIDTTAIYNFFASIGSGLAAFFGTKEGNIAAEMVVSFDAGFIVLFQIIISSIVMRFKPINAIISGIIVAAAGVALAFATQNPGYVVLGIFIFAIGEMSASPKFTEYIGRIAPKERVGLYMGYSFLPMAMGNYLAGMISGRLYQSMSDKVTLLKKAVTEKGFELPEITKEFTQNDLFNKASELMNMSQADLTEYLWKTYNPSKIWVVFLMIGSVTVIGLKIYDMVISRNAKKINVEND